MFSTRSPTLTCRSATTPSIGAWIDDFARRASPACTCAPAARVAASAASCADAASSSACCVMRPYSFNCTARSCSRRARASVTCACATTAFSASMPASVSEVSSCASRAPLRTGTHCVTYTALTVPDTSDLMSAKNFGASDPTTSTVSTISDTQAASRLTATGGRPLSGVGFGGSLPLLFVQAPAPAAATIARARLAAFMMGVMAIACSCCDWGHEIHNLFREGT